MAEATNDSVHEHAEDSIAAYARDLENESGVVTFDAQRRREVAALAHRDSLVEVLRARRLDLLPPTGDGAPYTTVQGREPGDSTAPTDISDLISSISTMGVLQPILVEEMTGEDGTVARHVVAGERRVRAVRWGATHHPDNPHFAQIPAVIVPGPLSDEDKRSWQLIENLAREDLQPGELASALLFERCAILVTKLLSHSIAVPRSVLRIDDPIRRFEELEKLRDGNPAAAAPWTEVLDRLGLQIPARKARRLIAAFKAMPAHVSDQMDDHQITLSTRIRFAELRKGREQAADEIWAALADTEHAKTLLPGAVSIAAEDPELDTREVLLRAQEAHFAANQARRDALTHEEFMPAPTAIDSDDVDAGDGGYGSEVAGFVGEFQDEDAGDGADVVELTSAPVIDPADSHLVTDTLVSLRALVDHLRTGRTPSKYEAGSLRVQVRRLIDALDNPVAASTEVDAA